MPVTVTVWPRSLATVAASGALDSCHRLLSITLVPSASVTIGHSPRSVLPLPVNSFSEYVPVTVHGRFALARAFSAASSAHGGLSIEVFSGGGSRNGFL